MKHTVIRILLVPALSLQLAGAAFAGFDEGVAAYERGDYAVAFEEFSAAAEQGVANAQIMLGAMYAEGKGVPQDYAAAVKWYRRAAEQGVAIAQNNLGVMYDKGNGVPQDYAAAVKWFSKYAEDDSDAQRNLRRMYEKWFSKYAYGIGVPEDDAVAVKWYRKAAEQGDADAQNNLGVMYDNGNGVPRDYAAAVKWYRKAAEQGDADAQYNLGVMYEYGRGVPEDYAAAMKWFRKAAEQGHARAQTNLGFMYNNGIVAVAAFTVAASSASPRRNERVSGPVSARVLRVIDGDTITVKAFIWVGQSVETEVRISGVDTPALRGNCASERRLAVAARDLVTKALGNARVVLWDIRYGKYAGRVVARVESDKGENIATLLITAGLGRPYGSGKRGSWCADRNKTILRGGY